MSAKPFGKPVHHGRALTKGLRLTIALWGAAVPAYFLCAYATRSYPTLADSPFFWPAAIGFGLFYAVSIAFWLRRRISPRAPGESSRTGLFITRFLLALLIALPAGFVSSLLYEPAFKLANGLGSLGSPTIEHAMVTRLEARWYLDSPYWSDNFRWQIKDVDSLPKDITDGSVAKVTFRTGLLGARRVASIEYTVLR